MTSEQMPPDPCLSLVDISKAFSGVQALDNVTFEVLPGEVHALLGENGAGKSTLMNVASGTLAPDAGRIMVEGRLVSSMTPAEARRLGIAIVHQHPAVLDDLTVAENIRLAIPADVLRRDGSAKATMRAMLEDVGSSAHLEDRVANLSLAQRHLLELAKALVLQPRILILDEPTAALAQDAVDLLFTRVRTAAAAGTGIVYITHRLAEVRELADRVTVLRDGRNRGTLPVAEVSDDELLALIVGRQLEQTFPPKADAAADAPIYLSLNELSSPGVTSVSVDVRRGEILGIAGVAGNGQSRLMATLAGLSRFTGSVTVNGQSMSSRALRNESAYLPSDRHREGLMMTLSVRENAALLALKRFVRLGFLNSRRETDIVGTQLEELAVKAPNMDTGVSSLSGGNQQKVVLSRALLSQPDLVVADEPTQGVDVGARAEIYRILRSVADAGTPVVVNSSDALELEGLCDRVLVMSRGQVVAELKGADVTEDRIVSAAVSATAQSASAGQEGSRRSSRFARFIQGDYSPVAILAITIVLLALFVNSQNDRYFTAFNIASILGIVTILGFISMGQTVAFLTQNIDLSVGPLAGFLVVVASFFIGNESTTGQIILGFVLMFLAATLTGLINGSLVRFGHFTSVAATLAIYIALQGLAFILRDGPEGSINSSIMAVLKTKWGPIPAAFVVLVVAVVILEVSLRRTRWGLQIRAIGSNEHVARSLGVNVTRVALLAFVTVSWFVFIGGVLFMAQIGIGDPSQGAAFTLTSITAVVLGGTAFAGGRGSFVGTLLGAVLLAQVLNATTMIGLAQWSTYFAQGALVVVAALIYHLIRTNKRALR
jgi:ribose transport system ATP-binding protein